MAAHEALPYTSGQANHLGRQRDATVQWGLWQDMVLRGAGEKLPYTVWLIAAPQEGWRDDKALGVHT